jgi:hypothetical protein
MLSALALALGVSACAKAEQRPRTSASGGTGGSGAQSTGGSGTTGGSSTGGTGVDSGAPDASTDASVDGGPDATPDGASDASPDARLEGGADATASGGSGGADAGPLGNVGSLRCNGLGHLSVPTSPAFFIPGDWTMEAWFEDSAPVSGGGEFDHGGYSIMGKGNGAEGQFHADVAWESITTGQRVNWADAANKVSYDMNAHGYKHGAWIHMATTFVASANTLTLFLNGVQVAQQTGVAVAGAANTNQLLLCGGIGGDWIGHIDDVRIWNVARTSGQISANYATEFVTSPAGLVANYKFDDAADLGHDATGNGHDGTYDTGVSFSAAHP